MRAKHSAPARVRKLPAISILLLDQLQSAPKDVPDLVVQN